LVLFFSWQLWREHSATRSALERESIAVRKALASQDRAQDLLARSLYEQARALGSAAAPGSRWQTLELIGEAERLRRRPRETPIPAPSDSEAYPESDVSRLPSQAELRSEAALAMLRFDLRRGRSIKMEAAQPGLSPGARFVLSRSGSGTQLRDLLEPATSLPADLQTLAGAALAVDSSGRRLASWQSQTDQITVCDLDSQGRRTALQWPQTPQQMRMLRTTGQGQLLSSDLAWSRDGRYLAVTDRRQQSSQPPMLVLWQPSASDEPRLLANITANSDLGGPCFRPDGRQLACATDPQTVTIWDTATAQPVDAIQLPLPLVGRLAWDPSGNFLACPCAGTGNATPPGPADGGIAWTGNASDSILIWDLSARRVTLQLAAPDDLGASVLAFHPTGRQLALGTRRGRLCTFELATGRQLIDRPEAHPFGVPVLGWADDGRRLVSWGVTEGLLKCWELSAPPRDVVRTGPLSGPFALSPDGRWLAVTSDEGMRVQVYNRPRGTLHRQLIGNAAATQSFLVFGNDSRQLAQLDADRAIVWDIGSGAVLARLEPERGLSGLITSVVFTPQGDLLAAVQRSGPPRVVVWDVLQGQEVWQAPSQMDFDSVFLVPPGRYLAEIERNQFGPEAELRVVELSTGKTIGAPELLPGGPIDWQSFSPDGRWMTSVQYLEGDPMFAVLGAVENVLARTQLSLRRMPPHDEEFTFAGQSTPTATVFSPDSRLLAIGYRDGMIRLCRVSDGEELFHFRLASQAVRQIAFDANATTLALRDAEGNVPTVHFVHLTDLRLSLEEMGLEW
jgi:WD40 repeat protein